MTLKEANKMTYNSLKSVGIVDKSKMDTIKRDGKRQYRKIK